MGNSQREGHDATSDEPEIEHQANTNQVRHEPVPASHDDDRRPAGVRHELRDDEDSRDRDRDHESG